MKPNNTDAHWERFAKSDPYFAVITHDRYRNAQSDEEKIRDFFATGEKYMEWVFERIRANRLEKDEWKRAMDFGCGMGRLVIPLSSRCELVVGVDVSDTMLMESKVRCENLGLTNVALIKGDDELSGVDGSFDLIHSYNVFQHIPCNRGLKLIERLIAMLREEGVGVIHLTYSKERHATSRESVWPSPTVGGWEHGVGVTRAAWRHSIRLFRFPLRVAKAVLRGGRSGVADLWTEMQMNCYALNPVIHRLQAGGARRLNIEMTDHGGEYGVIIFFRKQSTEPYCA